jgi:hypothetical protein
VGRGEVRQSKHDYPMELLFIGVGNAGGYVILSQGKLADGLVNDLLEAIHKYDETLYMATFIGVLELVKQQLIAESLENDDD